MKDIQELRDYLQKLRDVEITDIADNAVYDVAIGVAVAVLGAVEAAEVWIDEQTQTKGGE